MWTLERPAHEAGPTFVLCIERIRDADLVQRFQSIEDDIVGAAVDYTAAAQATSLHTLAHPAVVAGKVTTAEMSALYTQRLAKKGTKARPVYDAIMALAPNSRCPLCGQRSVSTLDHHLPKAHYPALAVTPLNLIPACADCNKVKIDAVPSTAAEETLHPYFDDIENDPWLVATVVQSTPAALRFDVLPHGSWNQLLTGRVINHFKTFGLAKLYAAQAAEELLSVRFELQQLFDKAGALQVQAHLAERATSCLAARTNSWRTAMYAALQNSAWFYGGGFAVT